LIDLILFVFEKYFIIGKTEESFGVLVGIFILRLLEQNCFSFFFIEHKMTGSKLPTYDELPIDSKYPPHTAWGLWGEDDNYGTLNLLTEETVAKVSLFSFQVKVPNSFRIFRQQNVSAAVLCFLLIGN
jgi:hypothetical protein